MATLQRKRARKSERKVETIDETTTTHETADSSAVLDQIEQVLDSEALTIDELLLGAVLDEKVQKVRRMGSGVRAWTISGNVD